MDNIEVIINDEDIILRYKDLTTKAFIGRKGCTEDPFEGNEKTPLGTFALGIAFGTHDNIQTNLDYICLNSNLYWVDDVKSNYYNELVNINNVKKDWNSAEHLIDYQKQYEYAIEIKTNPLNIKGLGSAIFLHCEVGNPTLGCVAINRDAMIYVLNNVKKDTVISIKKR